MTHFYTEVEGKVLPKHYVKMAKDPNKSRASRTTDAKKAFKESGEIWMPSVTGIIGILDKPALLNWKVDQHLEQAYQIDPTDTGMQYFDYLRTVKAKAQEKMDEAPAAGTAIHNVLEAYIKDGVMPEDTIQKLICNNVRTEIIKHCGIDVETDNDFQTERHFVDSELGYGGAMDLQNPDWVIDYKSKQTAKKFIRGKMAYIDHARQLVAYGEAVCSTGYQAANIFICLENGEVDFHVHKQESLPDAFLDFKDCLSLYHRNNYNPFTL